MDSLPLEIIFIVTLILLYLAMELGYKIGSRHPDYLKKINEKATTSSSTAVLGMLGFLLVFSFSIVYGRYDSKKELVREEANLIRNAWLRSDFLPDEDRAEAKKIFGQYIDLRIAVVEKDDPEEIKKLLNESETMQIRLWNMAVANARKDMNSDVAALYIESINEMINHQAIRIAIGLQARLPLAIWIMLFILVFLGMFSVGYDSAINGSNNKSWLTPIMIFSFALIIWTIASLDRPGSSIMPVTQLPMIDLKNWIGNVR